MWQVRYPGPAKGTGDVKVLLGAHEMLRSLWLQAKHRDPEVLLVGCAFEVLLLTCEGGAEDRRRLIAVCHRSSVLQRTSTSTPQQPQAQ